MTTETYPLTISRPPTTVAGYRVLAWAELRHIRGNYPGGIVLAVSNPEHSMGTYATWLAYTRDGGETWHASGGDYIIDHDQAWASFISRCSNLATEYGPLDH